MTEQNPKTNEERITFYKEMRLHPSSDRRHDLVIPMDDATETSKSAWDMLAAMVKASASKGATSPQAGDFASQQQKYQPLLRTAALYDFLFIYRNVSDDELSEYVEILKTPSYQTFNRSLNQSLVDIFVSRTEQAMNELGKSAAHAKAGSKH